MTYHHEQEDTDDRWYSLTAALRMIGAHVVIVSADDKNVLVEVAGVLSAGPTALDAAELSIEKILFPEAVA